MPADSPAPEPLARADPGRHPGRKDSEPVTALLIPDVEAAAMAGIARATWHRLRAAGKVPAPIKLGRACRWNRAEIVSWIEAGCPARVEWEARKAQNRRLRIAP